MSQTGSVFNAHTGMSMEWITLRYLKQLCEGLGGITLLRGSMSQGRLWAIPRLILSAYRSGCSSQVLLQHTPAWHHAPHHDDNRLSL